MNIFWCRAYRTSSRGFPPPDHPIPSLHIPAHDWTLHKDLFPNPSHISRGETMWILAMNPLRNPSSLPSPRHNSFPLQLPRRQIPKPFPFSWWQRRQHTVQCLGLPLPLQIACPLDRDRTAPAVRLRYLHAHRLHRRARQPTVALRPLRFDKQFDRMRQSSGARSTVLLLAQGRRQPLHRVLVARRT